MTDSGGGLDFGALLPKSWLYRYCLVMQPRYVFQLMVSKRLRKILSCNAGWLSHCRCLAAAADFTQEELTMLKNEKFWMNFYIDHCQRKIPLKPPRLIKSSPHGYECINEVPQIGSLVRKIDMVPMFGAIPTNLYVITNVVLHKSGKDEGLPSHVIISLVLDDFDTCVKKRYSIHLKVNEYRVKRRSAGNYAIDLTIIPPADYPCLNRQ